MSRAAPPKLTGTEPPPPPFSTDISSGALFELLGWELDKLLEQTLKAMQSEEAAIEAAVAALN